MHNVTAKNFFTTPVPVLDDGDSVDAAHTQPTIQALADQAMFNYNHSLVLQQIAARTWTAGAGPVNSVYETIVSVKPLRLLVAVGSGAPRIVTSPDGVTWTTRTSPVGTDTWRDLVYASGLSLLVAAGDGTTKVATSPDGITWTARPSQTVSLKAIAYSPTLNRLVGVSAATAQFYTSADGITWAAVTSGITHIYNDITWSPTLGKFLAVTSNFVASSTDGLVWTEVAGPANLTYVTWSTPLGIFAAVTGTLSSIVSTSPDGITWTSRTISTVGLQGTWQRIAWSNELGMFMATDIPADNTTRALISVDGVNWVGVLTGTIAVQGKAICWCDYMLRFAVLPNTAATAAYLSL